MKLFRIFAVGLIISAVVVATAIAPITNAVGGTAPPPSFSSNFFTLPVFNLSSFDIATLNYTPVTTSTTGPISDPPEADVVPNFSGLVVNGPTAIDGDDDGIEDIIIDEDGEIFINNKFAINANPSDGNNEFELIGTDSLIIGDYPAGAHMLIDNAFLERVGIDAGLFSVISPQVKFSTTSGDVDFEIEGDLQVDGSIQSAEAIGSYYRRYYDTTTNAVSANVPCFTGDFLTGCSGKNVLNYAIQGTGSSLTTCWVYNVGSHRMKVYATCFDPSGTHTGSNLYDPNNPDD